jgi:hypothetical protein
MKRFIVSSENGPTIKTWAYSARNARFAYTLMHGNCGLVSCGKVTVAEMGDAR